MINRYQSRFSKSRLPSTNESIGRRATNRAAPRIAEKRDAATLSVPWPKAGGRSARAASPLRPLLVPLSRIFERSVSPPIGRLSTRFALRIPLAVAAEAQTPATRARGSNVRVAGAIPVRDSVWSRGVIQRTAGGDQTLVDADGPLEFLSSDALVADGVGRGSGGRGAFGHRAVGRGTESPSIKLGRRRRRTAASVLRLRQRHRNRKRQHFRHAVLHVVGQSRGQTARVQLIKFDQLQQVVEPGYAFVQGVQPAVASLVENL